MSEFDHRWGRLVRRARGASASEEFAAAPPGFATRVVALARSRSAGRTAWEFVSTRCLAAACVLTIASVGTLWPVLSEASHGDELADLADPLTEVALLE